MEVVDQDFTAGMTSDAKTPPPNSFLEAVNFELVSDEHNTYAFESVKGTRVIVNVTKNYRPIGFAKGTTKVILYSAYVGPLAMTNGEIAVLTFTETSVGTTAVYTPQYNHQELNFRPEFMIGQEAYLYPENAFIEPSYWTDENTPPKTFNHADPIFSTYIASGSLIIGKKYMVLDMGGSGTTASIFYGSTPYGPNSTNGTVFTADNINGNTFYDPTGTCKVIEYFAVELLDWTPQIKIGAIRFKEHIIGGNLFCGAYTYFYQQADNKGFFSKWSQGSRLVQVATPNTPGGNADAYQATQGHPSTTASAIGNRMIIEGIDTIYERTRVAVIFYNEYNIPSGNPMLIFDGVTTGPDMTIDHTGNNPLGTLSLADIAIISSYIGKVGTVATVNNIALAGKVETEADFGWNPAIGVTVKPALYDVPADVVPYGINIPVIQPTTVPGHGLSGTEQAQNSVVYIRPNQWYRVTGTGSINYAGTVYVVGAAFQGKWQNAGGTIPNTWSAATGSPSVEAIIRILRYGVMPLTSPASNVLDIHILDDYYDQKGQATDHYISSLQRGEKYRYGILFFGKGSNPNLVRWLTDAIIPEMWKETGDTYVDADGTTKNVPFAMRLGEMFPQVNPDTGANYATPGSEWVNPGNNAAYCLRHVGVEIGGINFKALKDELGIASYQDLKNYFSGFSIVRVPRTANDKQVITQGILFPCQQRVNGFEINPQGPITQDETADLHGRQSNQYAFYSLEALMAQTQNYLHLNFSIQDGDQLKIVDYLYDYSPEFSPGKGRYSTNNLTIAIGFFRNLNGQYYNKFLYRVRPCPYNDTPGDPMRNPNGTFGKTDPIDFKYTQYVDTNIRNISLGGSYYLNNNGLAKPVTDGSIGDGEYVGNKFLYIQTKNFEGDGSNTYPYGFGWRPLPGSPGSQDRTPWKPLVNIIRPKNMNDYYSGTSDSAKAQNVYISTGHFQAFDQAFTSYLATHNGIADGIQIFAGDIKLCMVDISRVMQYIGNSGGHRAIGFTSFFPCEQTLNVQLREGDHLSRNNGINYPNQPEQFVNNPAYASEATDIEYTAIPLNYKPNNKHPYRVIHSDKKVPGEQRNSFRVFDPITGYKDVDGQRGFISNIRAKMMRLFYWQETGIGSIPINERQVGPAMIAGAPFVIGEGGVAERYDERTNFYGNQHKFGLGEFEEGFTWVDFKRRAFCFMNTAPDIVEMNEIRDLLTDFHNLPAQLTGKNQPMDFKDVVANTSGGIVSQYDARFKRILTTFILNNIEDIFIPNDFGGMHLKKVTPIINKTLIFDVTKKMFGGWFTAAPALSFNFNEHYFSIAPINATWGLPNTQFNIGDIVSLGNITNFVCIAPFIHNTIFNPTSFPLNFVQINSTEELHQHYINDIGLFYGLIADGKIKYAVTGEGLRNSYFSANQNIEKIFDFHRWKASMNFFDELNVFANGNISGKDINLPTNPEYDYRNRAWYASIPLDTNTGEQVQDYKMIVELMQKNGLNGSFTQSKNQRITLSSVQTTWRKAY